MKVKGSLLTVARTEEEASIAPPPSDQTSDLDGAHSRLVGQKDVNGFFLFFFKFYALILYVMVILVAQLKSIWRFFKKYLKFQILFEWI